MARKPRKPTPERRRIADLELTVYRNQLTLNEKDRQIDALQSQLREANKRALQYNRRHATLWHQVFGAPVEETVPVG